MDKNTQQEEKPKQYEIDSLERLVNLASKGNIDRLSIDLLVWLNYIVEAMSKAREGMPEYKDRTNWDLFRPTFTWVDDGINNINHVKITNSDTGEVTEIYQNKPLPPAPEPADIQEAAEGYLTRKIDTNKYYWCKCENCGWEDSSEFLEGCHPIADTGDHSDPVCPVCFCNKIEGEPTIEVPESYSGEVEVKIPLDTVINPYKKTIESLNNTIEDLRYPTV